MKPCPIVLELNTVLTVKQDGSYDKLNQRLNYCIRDFVGCFPSEIKPAKTVEKTVSASLKAVKTLIDGLCGYSVYNYMVLAHDMPGKDRIDDFMFLHMAKPPIVDELEKLESYYKTTLDYINSHPKTRGKPKSRVIHNFIYLLVNIYKDATGLKATTNSGVYGSKFVAFAEKVYGFIRKTYPDLRSPHIDFSNRLKKDKAKARKASMGRK